MLEKHDAIAQITIEGQPYTLCVNFPCGLSSLIVQAGDTVKTGDRIAVCVSEGEDIPYGRDYLFIRAV